VRARARRDVGLRHTVNLVTLGENAAIVRAVVLRTCAASGVLSLQFRFSAGVNDDVAIDEK
jgi:hypothetical protein